MQPETSGIKPWQWVVTVIVIIALVVIGIMVFSSKKTEVTTTTEEENTPATEETTSLAGEANRITMSDQFPGDVVYVSSVQLANGGWVVVHKDNAGKPGEVIGSAYFAKGINPGKITLTKPTVAGATYYAALHADDGDKKFDATKDLPLKDSKGNEIMKVFKANASANVDIKG